MSLTYLVKIEIHLTGTINSFITQYYAHDLKPLELKNGFKSYFLSDFDFLEMCVGKKPSVDDSYLFCYISLFLNIIDNDSSVGY